MFIPLFICWMELNINDEIKIKILEQLSDGKVYSFYLLAKKVKANKTTVKKNAHSFTQSDLSESMKSLRKRMH